MVCAEEALQSEYYRVAVVLEFADAESSARILEIKKGIGGVS
jgi:hypothetical protein